MGFKDKIRNIMDCRESSSIYDIYYNEGIDENLVYFESRNGRDFAGNILRVIEELSTGRYGDFKIHVFANPKTKLKIEGLKKNYNLKIDRIVTTESEAARTLERAKYIFTDSGIRYKYVKRDSQVFVNLWHGTPLKLMGRDYPLEIPAIAHIQQPLLSSDYLLYPNEYMMNIMLEAYQIEKIYPGEILLEGYPRNAVLFDEKRRLELKEKLGFEAKEVFIYMPTYRGQVQEIDDQRDFISEILARIDERLTGNQVLISKLHPYDESSIDYSSFNHIIGFPKGYETYDVLNVCDALITDYSSVFFDYANTKGKIILFNYDEREYLSSRGVYIPLDDLPFPKVQDIDDLVLKLNSPKDYDDTEFLETFCSHDSIDATERLCRHMFKGENVCSTISVESERENILIYPGEIDSDFTDFVSRISDDYNVFITYNPWERPSLDNLPENVEILPFRFNLTPTFDEKRDYNRYFTSKDMECPKSLERLFKRSYDKQFSDVDFSLILDYAATNANITSIFANSAKNSAIWIREDTFDKANPNVLADMLSRFTHIVADTPDLADRFDGIIFASNVEMAENIKKII